MRSAKELVAFCKERTKQLGMTQAEMLRKANCSPTMFVMLLQRDTYPRVETLVEMAKVLEVSVSDILGTEDTDIPDDIQQMVNMLKDISPENRKMISMNIENYLQVERQNKKKK